MVGQGYMCNRKGYSGRASETMVEEGKPALEKEHQWWRNGNKSLGKVPVVGQGYLYNRTGSSGGGRVAVVKEA